MDNPLMCREPSTLSWCVRNNIPMRCALNDDLVRVIVTIFSRSQRGVGMDLFRTVNTVQMSIAAQEEASGRYSDGREELPFEDVRSKLMELRPSGDHGCFARFTEKIDPILSKNRRGGVAARQSLAP